jgi:hypothetical protein
MSESARLAKLVQEHRQGGDGKERKKRRAKEKSQKLKADKRRKKERHKANKREVGEGQVEEAGDSAPTSDLTESGTHKDENGTRYVEGKTPDLDETKETVAEPELQPMLPPSGWMADGEGVGVDGSSNAVSAFVFRRRRIRHCWCISTWLRMHSRRVVVVRWLQDLCAEKHWRRH